MVDAFAAKQHGVFSLTQLRAAGFDRYAVRRRIQTSRWTQLDYRTYCAASAPSTWERQMWAALLSRPFALVGGRSAAFLHSLRGFKATKPVIVVPGSANTRSNLARIIRAEHYQELKMEQLAGFPVTTVAETIVCLASELVPGHLDRVFDDALLASKLELNAVADILDREAARRRRGIVHLRQLAADRDESAPSVDSSYLEAMLETVLAQGGVPSWTREYPFALNGRAARVDFFIPSWLLVVEADGRSWHARTGDFENDRLRDNELAARGIQVLRFTYQMLDRDPRGCLATITATGRVRSA